MVLCSWAPQFRINWIRSGCYLDNYLLDMTAFEITATVLHWKGFTDNLVLRG